MNAAAGHVAFARQEILDLLHNDDETEESLMAMVDLPQEVATHPVKTALRELLEERLVRRYQAPSFDRGGMRQAIWWTLLVEER